MTDRHVGYVVVLDHSVRDDDAIATITALQQIKGVIEVRPVIGSVGAESMAATRTKHEIMGKLYDFMRTL